MVHHLLDNCTVGSGYKIIIIKFVTISLYATVKIRKRIKMNNQFVNPLFFVMLIVLVLLTIFGIVYLYVTSKTRERLALIEKGMDPNLAKSDFWIQVGIISAGAALGLMVGDIIPGKYGPLVSILFAGAGLVIYNIIRKRNARGNKK
jgi:hypothetical protein